MPFCHSAQAVVGFPHWLAFNSKCHLCSLISVERQPWDDAMVWLFLLKTVCLVTVTLERAPGRPLVGRVWIRQARAANPHCNTWVKYWKIILARASSHFHSAHTYVNWSFPFGSGCNSELHPVLCRAVNQCNPGGVCSGQLAGGITYEQAITTHDSGGVRSRPLCFSTCRALIRVPLPSSH